MNRYKYGNAGDPKVFVDWHSVTNLQFVWNHNVFVRLANRLIDEGDNARAVEVLDRCLKEYPYSKFNYDYDMAAARIPYSMIEAYYAAGATERADLLLEDYANVLQEYIEYYIRFDGAKAGMVASAWTDKFEILNELAYLARHYQRNEQYEAIDAYLDLFEEDEESD
jgi:tetratricopeptide (TPR) repeat protein